MKILYENHTTSALEVELRNVKNLIHLVNEMKKPDNFTYMDVINLHNHLSILRDCIQEELHERAKI